MTRIIILVLFISVLIILPAFSEKENEDKDLVQITMKADIDTASYYELKTWAERLELDTTGSKEELKKNYTAIMKSNLFRKIISPVPVIQL